MRRAHTIAALVTGITTFGLLASGCSASNGSPTSADLEVTMSIDGSITSLDPAKSTTYQDGIVAQSLYDTLVSMDAEGNLVAGLASAWEVTDTSVTFTIREDVTCSDGTDLTAQVVADSLTRFFAPETAAPNVSGVIGPGNTATVVADGQTVTVTDSAPYAALLNGFTTPSTGIVCAAGLTDVEALAATSFGTGPYTAVDQAPGGENYTFASREDYSWGPDLGAAHDGERASTLVLKVVTDESTRANLQSTGELDVASYTSDAWQRFDTGSYSVESSPQSYTMLTFNENEGHPTADPEVRLAIMQAIDRERLNEVQSFGEGELLTNLGGDTYACYDDSLGDLIPATDVAAASAVLSGLDIRVIGTTIVANGDANSYVQSALEAAGANATLNNMENGAWATDLFTPANDWDVTILVVSNSTSTYRDIGMYYVGEAPPTGSNLGAVDNPQAEAFFEAALSQAGEAGCSAMSSFQTSLLENHDVLPLASAPAHAVFTGGVSADFINGFVRTGTIRVQGSEN